MFVRGGALYARRRGCALLVPLHGVGCARLVPLHYRRIAQLCWRRPGHHLTLRSHTDQPGQSSVLLVRAVSRLSRAHLRTILDGLGWFGNSKQKTNNDDHSLLPYDDHQQQPYDEEHHRRRRPMADRRPPQATDAAARSFADAVRMLHGIDFRLGARPSLPALAR